MRISPLGLIALQASTPLAPGGDPPSRIVMLKWGKNDTAQGSIIVGDRTLSASKMWDQIGFGEVALDFNHNTVPGHPSYKGEPAPIAAMSGVKVVRGVGLVFDPVKWTPEGIKQRANYRDYSPAVKVDDQNEVIFVHSAALARNGAVKDLHAFAADAINPTLSRKISTLMSATQSDPTAKAMALLKKYLRVAPDASDEQVLAALSLPKGAPQADIDTAIAKAFAKRGPIKTMSAGTGAMAADRPATETNPGTLNIELLLETLGLPADATDDDVNEVMENLLAQIPDVREKQSLALPSDASQQQLDAARLARWESDLAAMTDAQRRTALNLPDQATPADVQATIQTRRAEMLRIAEAKRIETLSAAAATLRREELDVIQKMGLPLSTYLKHNPPTLKALAAVARDGVPDQMEINRRLGVTPEMWSRHNNG